VKLADGRTFDNARVLGEDARTDVAGIKINAGDLPTVPLGDSSKVRVGDWAIAVGNPFGLEKTLTVGVISATAREVPLSEAGPGDYLQTDASINPGNSGGPLLDIYGRVIGINNAIYSRTGGNVGIGFAIPANTAREIADILVNEGRVRRALLGVSVTDLDASRARAFGLDNALRGALIESVAPDSPASRAGLQPGDVVTSINGEPVTDAGDLQTRVSRSAIGSEVRLTVRRGGKDLNLTARLAELTAGSPARPDHRAAPAPPDTPAGLGIALAPLNAETARRFQIGVGARGVVIAAVAAGSPAAQVGLRPGDVIERVGQTPVATPQQVQTEVQRIARSQTGTRPMIALYIHRGGEKRYAMVPFRE
jgi:serine protease Do